MKSALRFFGLTLSTIFSITLVSAGSASACPSLAGDYKCVSLETGASTSLQVIQSVRSNGINSFQMYGEFGGPFYYLSDGVSYPSTTPSGPTSQESHSAICSGNQLIVDGNISAEDGTRTYRSVFRSEPMGMTIATTVTQAGGHRYVQVNRFECN